MNRKGTTLPALCFAVAAFLVISCSPEPGTLQELTAEISNVETSLLQEIPTERVEDESITIMSWNVKGNAFRSDGDHLKKIAELIREHSPDIVMLQEIHRNTTASGEQDQFEVLTKALNMNGCFGESLLVGEGSYGNAILSTGAIRGGRRFLLPGRGEPRTILECRSTWNGLDLPLLTTHLTAWDRANRRIRRLQTEAIADLVDSNGSPLLILGGDFNASLGSSEMMRLVGDTLVRPAIPGYVVTHQTSGRSYDHLFVGDGWAIDDARIIKQGPSDHWPVIAELSVEPDGEPR